MSHLNVPELWKSRVVLLTLLEHGTTEESLRRSLASYGTVVKAQAAKSQKGNVIAYVSFEHPQSVELILKERGPGRYQSSSDSWKGQAKIPEGGEWNKWIQPTASELRDARTLQEKVSASSHPSRPAAVPARAPLVPELDPRQIFFIGSLLSANEQTKELKAAFGNEFQHYPLFVSDVIKAGMRWFPASLERCESFNEFDQYSQVYFTDQVSDNPRWKSFLKKADPRFRSPEKVLVNHIKNLRIKRDFEQQLVSSNSLDPSPPISLPPAPYRITHPTVLPVSVPPPQPPFPATSTNTTRPPNKNELLRLYMKPMLITPTDLCSIASSVAMIDLDASRDIELAQDGSYSTIRFSSVERADRAYALLDGLRLNDGGSKLSLYRTRSFVKDVVVTERIHLDTPLGITPAALYISLSHFGLINSCQPGNADDETPGVVVQFVRSSARQDLLRQLRDGEQLPNRGQIFVWNIDTLEKLLDLATQMRSIGRVDLSSKDLGANFRSHNSARFIRVGDLSTAQQIEKMEFRADGTTFAVHFGELGKMTAREYPHFEAPSPSLKEFYGLNVQRVASHLPTLSVGSPCTSINAVAGPSRLPLPPSSSSSHQHQPPQDPRRAAPSASRRPPSPPPTRQSSSSSSAHAPYSRATEERRRSPSQQSDRTMEANPSFHETERGGRPRASGLTRADEDATMTGPEEPPTGASQKGGTTSGPTGERVVPRGKRRSVSPDYVPPAQLSRQRPRARRSRATDPVFFLQGLATDPKSTQMSTESAETMLEEDSGIRKWVMEEIVKVKDGLKLEEKGKLAASESRMSVEGGGGGEGSGMDAVVV